MAADFINRRPAPADNPDTVWVHVWTVSGGVLPTACLMLDDDTVVAEGNPLPVVQA